MQKNNHICFNKTGLFFSSLLFFVTFLWVSCDDDDNKSGETTFEIEGNPSGLSVVAGGVKEQAYIVRSNQKWQIVAQEEQDWATVFPMEGEDDGIFKITVDENESFDPRVVNYAFIVDGEEQPVLFRVEQDENVPYLIITNASEGISIPSAGGDVSINISANVDWTYSIEENSWLTQQEITTTQIKLLAAKNSDIQRSVKLTATCAEYSLSHDIILTQSSGSVILQEDFNWFTYSNSIFYSTTNAVRFDSWSTDDKTKGWTTTPNTSSNSEPLLYACYGFVKVGKTGYGGDLISPKLEIEGTRNVTVTFKAVPYLTKGGLKDNNTLNIKLIGPGTVISNQFIIDNWPTYPANATEHDTYCKDFWNNSAAERSFTITGATSDTQIVFLGGDYYLVGVGAEKNRIFLDDIMVTLIPE